jgi:hypothetical protein
MRSSEYIFTQFEGNSFKECRVRAEGLVKIDAEGDRGRNIRRLLIEASVYIDVVFDHKTDMAESVDAG